MKVIMSLGKGVLRWSDVCLSRPEIRKLFSELEVELRNHPTFKDALLSLGVTRVGSVSIYFCDDVEMRSLQMEYRNLDRTTDVLSFPALEVSGIKELYSHLKSGDRSWGDIVVSLPTVLRGAKRAKRSERLELQEVLIHAFLHLLGMDHVQKKGIGPSDAKAMKTLQKKLFNRLKI